MQNTLNVDQGCSILIKNAPKNSLRPLLERYGSLFGNNLVPGPSQNWFLKDFERIWPPVGGAKAYKTTFFCYQFREAFLIDFWWILTRFSKEFLIRTVIRIKKGNFSKIWPLMRFAYFSGSGPSEFDYKSIKNPIKNQDVFRSTIFMHFWRVLTSKLDPRGIKKSCKKLVEIWFMFGMHLEGQKGGVLLSRRFCGVP